MMEKRFEMFIVCRIVNSDTINDRAGKYGELRHSKFKRKDDFYIEEKGIIL